MCGPKFCSMEITQQVREYAISKGLEPREAVEAGLAEKSAEFKREREIYVAPRG
jgi:phosphomethylpyrimidine synthase